MRKTLYLFFVLFYHIAAAKSTPEETIISNKLRNLTKPNIDQKQKEASRLQLKAESEKRGYGLSILVSGDYLILFISYKMSPNIVFTKSVI